MLDLFCPKTKLCCSLKTVSGELSSHFTHYSDCYFTVITASLWVTHVPLLSCHADSFTYASLKHLSHLLILLK